jgi:hypothetical protein
MGLSNVRPNQVRAAAREKGGREREREISTPAVQSCPKKYFTIIYRMPGEKEFLSVSKGGLHWRRVEED